MSKYREVAKQMAVDYLELEKITQNNTRGIPYTALGAKYNIDSSYAGNLWRGVRIAMIGKSDSSRYGQATKRMFEDNIVTKISELTYKNVDELYSIQGNAGMTILLGIEAAKQNELNTYESLFNNEVDTLLLKSKPLDKPKGTNQPEKLTVTQYIQKRDPKVKAWILRNANGKCELCKKEAPFKKENSLPYLEVHHIIQLANGGADTVENTVAVCPNCHRALHISIHKKTLAVELRKNLTRFQN